MADGSLDKFTEVQEKLVAGAQLSVESERVDVGKRVAAIITDVYRGQGKKLPLKEMARHFGLERYLKRLRGGFDLDFAAAIADVLSISVDQVPKVDINPKSVADVVAKKVDKVFVPTNKKARKVGTGQEVFEVKDTLPRCELTLKVLNEMGVDIETVQVWEGMVTDEMMRELPYFCFVVPSLNRIILVCEEEGNQTFVVYGSQDYDKFSSMSKDQLKTHDAVGFFKWNSDHNKWKVKLSTHLSSAVPIKEQNDKLDGSVEPVSGEEVFDGEKMDRAYFENVDNIKYDLNAYARALSEADGSEKSALDLSTVNIRKLTITCKNGEKVSGFAYILRVGVAFGLCGNQAEAKSHATEVLEELLERAGCNPMTRKYFGNIENIKYDLEAYASVLGPDKSPLNLRAGSMRNLSISCRNGQNVNGLTYINRFGVATGVVKDTKKFNSQAARVFDCLIEAAGYRPMNKKYFTDVENLKHDLEAYATALGPDKTPLDLTTENILNLLVSCKNGEKIKGRSYITRFGLALGLSKNARDVWGKASDILKNLLEAAGYQSMDKKYFENTENLKYDLEAYAKVLGSDKTVLNLKTHHLRELSAVCKNGEKILFLTYLRRFAVAVGFVHNQTEAGAVLSDVLVDLKKRIT